MADLAVELQDCPFCGGKAEIKIILGRDTICCKDCNATMISDYTPIETLIEMWNKRIVKKVTAVWTYTDSELENGLRCSNCNKMSEEETEHCQHCGATMVMSHIEPCPFCKTTPLLYKDKLSATQWGYAIRCNNGYGCIARPKTDYNYDLQTTIDRWNNCLQEENNNENY